MSQATDALSQEVDLLRLDDAATPSLKSLCATLRPLVSPGLETLSLPSWQALESLLLTAEAHTASIPDPPPAVTEATDYLTAVSQDLLAYSAALRDAMASLTSPAEQQKLLTLQAPEKLAAAERASALASTLVHACHVHLSSLSARKAWESAHPIEAAQESELARYRAALTRTLLTSQGGKALNDLGPAQWAEAERQLHSLEAYLTTHKIRAPQLRAANTDPLLRSLLRALERLDETGINFQKVDVARAQRVWGLADKLGSGVSYLLQVDARRQRSAADAAEPAPTSHAIFLLKSAPPAAMAFSASPAEWRAKQLRRCAERLGGVVLSDDAPIAVGDEQRWSAAFTELAGLEELLGSGVTLTNIRESGIDEVVRGVMERIRVLEKERAGSEVGDLSLMYISWELAMRIGTYFSEVEE